MTPEQLELLEAWLNARDDRKDSDPEWNAPLHTAVGNARNDFFNSFT